MLIQHYVYLIIRYLHLVHGDKNGGYRRWAGGRDQGQANLQGSANAVRLTFAQFHNQSSGTVLSTRYFKV